MRLTAHLAHVHLLDAEHAASGDLEVGIGRDDDRRLAAELERRRGERLGRGASDNLADGTTTSVADWDR